jgi:hypothetical protein
MAGDFGQNAGELVGLVLTWGRRPGGDSEGGQSSPAGANTEAPVVKITRTYKEQDEPRPIFKAIAATPLSVCTTRVTPGIGSFGPQGARSGSPPLIDSAWVRELRPLAGRCLTRQVAGRRSLGNALGHV